MVWSLCDEVRSNKGARKHEEQGLKVIIGNTVCDTCNFEDVIYLDTEIHFHCRFLTIVESARDGFGRRLLLNATENLKCPRVLLPFCITRE